MSEASLAECFPAPTPDLAKVAAFINLIEGRNRAHENNEERSIWVGRPQSYQPPRVCHIGPRVFSSKGLSGTTWQP